jgi:hypothetical protein
MDDSVLWAVALGVGMFGLMLLAIAGAIVVYWNTIVRKPEKSVVADETEPHAEETTAAEKKQSPPSPVAEKPVLTNSGWLWVKAWIFAVLHATTVSLVVGGMTFFEDLARAGTEIQQEGQVSFPKQLMPGTISGSGPSQKRLSRSLDGSSDAADAPRVGKLDQPIPGEDGWEVVDNLVAKAGSDSG